MSDNKTFAASASPIISSTKNSNSGELLRCGDLVLIKQQDIALLFSHSHKDDQIINTRILSGPFNIKIFQMSVMEVMPQQQHKQQKRFLKKYGSYVQDRFWEQTHKRFQLLTDRVKRNPQQEEIYSMYQSMMEELSANDKEVARLHGTPILYGQTIQLRHNYTKKYLSVSLKSAKTDSNSMRVMISRNITKHSNFRIMPAYKIRTEGEAVRQGDKIVLHNVKSGYLGCTPNVNEDKLIIYQFYETVIGSSPFPWTFHVFQDNTMANVNLNEEIPSSYAVRIYNKESQNYLASSFGANSLGLIKHEFHPSKPTHSNDIATFFSFVPLEESKSKAVKWGEPCRISSRVNSKYLVVNPELAVAQVFGIPTPDPMEDHSLFKVFSIEKTTSEYLNASKPVRIFHIKTKTWMQISEEDVNLDEAKVKEDIVMNRVGAVMDSRIKFSSHMEVSDFSNALVLFPVKMKQIDEMEYVTNFRRVVRQINDLSRKNNEDKFVNITHEEEQALIEIIGKLIIFSTDSHDINPFTRVGLPISFHQQLIRQTGLLDSFVAFLNIPEKQWDVLKSEKRHLEGGSGPATGNLVGLDAADAAVSSTSLSATNHSGIKTVMRFVHRLLTVFLKGKNEDNEIYIFNYFKLIQSQISFEDINASDTMREMLLGSKLVLERITQNDVQGIVKLLQTEKDSNLVDALVNMCTFEGSANLRLQHIIISAFFKTNAASNVLMPMRLTTEGLIEISYKGTPMPLANFFEIAARRDKDVFMALLRLKEAIAAGKNSVAIKMLILDLKLISLDLCLAGIKDATLPPGTRAQFCKIMNTLFLDTVHIDINPARMIVMFDSVPSATKSSAVVIDVTAKKIGQIAPLNYVPSLHYNQDTDLPKYPQFAELNQFISEFLDSCCQQQVADSAALDGLMSSVLVLLDSLFNLGVYNQDGAIEKLLPALLSVLDGRSGADKGGLEAITSTMALRFVRDEHSSLKIDTKTQICNILNKVLEWRLKNRISKVISVWKSDWTNAKSHSNIISVIGSTDFKPFENLTDVLFDLIMYEDKMLRRSAFHILQRNFATYEEIFENLSQTLILKGDASLSLYTAICKLVRSFSEIPKAFMTDSDADHMIKILDDMTSKCKQNLHNDDLEQTDVVPNFTAQEILRNFNLHIELLSLIELVRNNQTITSESIRQSVLLACSKLLEAMCCKNLGIKDEVFESLEMLLGLLSDPNCVSLFLELFCSTKSCLNVEKKDLEVILGYYIKHRNEKFVALIQRFIHVDGTAIKQNQVTVVDFFSKRGLLSMKKTFVDLLDPLIDNSQVNISNIIDVLYILCDCCHGESLFVESLIQNMLPFNVIVKLIALPDVDLKFKTALISILINAWITIVDQVEKRKFELSDEAATILSVLYSEVNRLLSSSSNTKNRDPFTFRFIAKAVIPYLDSVCEEHSEKRMITRFSKILAIIKLICAPEIQQKIADQGGKSGVSSLANLVKIGKYGVQIGFMSKEEVTSMEQTSTIKSGSNKGYRTLVYQDEEEKSVNDALKKYLFNLEAVIEDMASKERNELLSIFWKVHEKSTKIEAMKSPISLMSQYLVENLEDCVKDDLESEHIKKMNLKGVKLLTKMVKRELSEEKSTRDQLRDIEKIQNVLNECDVTMLAIMCSSSMDRDILKCGLRLFKYLLLGGNTKIQQRLYDYFIHTKEESIFFVFHSRLKEHIQSLTELKSLFLHLNNSRDTTPTDGWGAVSSSSSSSDIFDQKMLKEAKLLLRVIQLFVEGHFKPLQKYLREQPDNIKSFDIVSLICEYFNSICILNKRVNLGPYFDVHIQCMDSIIDLVQGSVENKKAMFFGKIINSCMTLLQQPTNLQLFNTKEGGERWQLKIKAMSILRHTMANDSPKMKEHYKEICHQLDWSLVVTTVMDEAYSLKDLDQPELLGAGFDSYKLYSVLRKHISSEDKKYVKSSDKPGSAFRYFKDWTGEIEVVKDDGRLAIHYFTRPDFVKYLNKPARDELVDAVDRSSPANKLKDFLERSDTIIYQLKYSEKLEKDRPLFDKFLGFLTSWFGVLWKIAYLCAVILNTINAICLKVPSAPVTVSNSTTNGSSNITLWAPYSTVNSTRLLKDSYCAWYPATSLTFGALYVLFWILLIIEYTFRKFPVIYYKTCGRGDASDQDMEKEDTTSQGKLIKYLKIGLVYITSTESIHHLVLLAIALLGIFGYPVAFFVLLADIVYRNPLIQAVVSAFSSKGGELGSVAWMAAISIFSYSVISSIVIGPLYITDQCDYLYECFGDLATMSLSGGFLGALSYSSLTQSQTAWAYIFTISFYIIISSVILNAVTGLIIDSFGAQRGEKEDNENEMANNCFICSLNRNEFSKYANEFEDHIQKDHYMWTYLEFLAYIREVDPTEYSDTESYIVKKIADRDIGWFPVNRSKRLDDNEAEKKQKTKEEKDPLNDRMDSLDRKLEAILKTLSRQQAGSSSESLVKEKSSQE